MDSDWLNKLLRREFRRLREVHAYRSRAVYEVADSTHLILDGRRFVNFASNNYLGLTHHPRVLAAMEHAVRAHGAGAAASPLVTGHHAAHARAEAAIAAWKGTERAVLLPSGYQASHAIVQTLAAIATLHEGGVRFLVDKLSHASLIDALRSADTQFRVFPHNHVSKLQRLLEEAPPDQLQVVVTESIFSMDGDAADLAGIVALKKIRPFILVLDEAHGSGVYGPGGAGYAAELGLADEVDITLITLSKAAGISGGAVCASEAFCDAVVNFGRACIYSTAIAPPIAAGIEAALDVMGSEPQRQSRVRGSAKRVRGVLHAGGLSIPAGDSPIIPVLLGDEARALDAAATLRELGLLTIPIRPPTVPRGTSRLRITLSADHTDEELELLTRAIVNVGK